MSINTNIILCFDCQHPIYRLNQATREGDLVNAEALESLLPDRYQAPRNFEPMHCPLCGQFPFVLHNTGLQMLTLEGIFIPEPKPQF